MESGSDQLANYSGQWGLAALLLGSLVIIFFPLMSVSILGVLIGAWNINEVELRHIEIAEIGIRVVVYGLLGLSALACFCGVMGLIRAVRHGQSLGLPVAGAPTGLVALAAAIVLVQIAHYAIEDSYRLRNQHPRFKVVSK